MLEFKGLTALACATMPADRWARVLRLMKEADAEAIDGDWPYWARDEQLPPASDWRVWLLMAGRGFGKTRAGAEWARGIAEADGTARIALVGATLSEARAVMVEGPSGLLGIAPDGRRPDWQASLRRLRWPNGAEARLYAASDPEALRGPQHGHAAGPGAEGAVPQRSARPDRRGVARRRADDRRQ